VLALSSHCRRPDDPPSAFLARAERLGFRALALDPALDGGWLAELAPDLRVAGLQAIAVEAPCPRTPGQRPADLASADRDERAAALKAFETTVRTAGDLGAPIVVVRLGRLEIPGEPAATRRAFARRELDGARLERLVEERRKLSAQALDRARFGLDRALERAAAAGVTLAVVTAGLWTDLPSAAELALLCDELAGAPLQPWYDAARAHVRRTLGFGNGRPAVELERAAGAFLTDAAGLRGDLPWRTGEVDRAAVLAALPAGAARVLRSRIATDEELAAALAAA
jgi:sugar phosphate isomerase/epimerase